MTRIRRRIGAGLVVMFSLLVLTPFVARPSYAASTPSVTEQAGACRGTATALTGSEMAETTGGDPIDGICFIAGACVGIWPIGTAICGPTAVGCVIHYWQM
jgi:hypothetical protein